MGGRGSFTPSFSKNALSERLPQSLKEALGTQGESRSMSDAVVFANPHYSPYYRDYSENCQRVVVAYELRRRGFDVTAQPTYEGDKLPEKNRWRGAFKGAKTTKVGVIGNNDTAIHQVMDNIQKQMNTYGDGSRAVISVLYRKQYVGHVFNVEYVNKEVRYIEAQTGDIYTNYGIVNFLKSVKTDSVELTRVDNLKVSERAKKAVWKRDRK